MPYRIHTHLTGTTRHRVGWRGRMVLEVEESHRRVSVCSPPPHRTEAEWEARQIRMAGTPWTTWRDASVADMLVLERRKARG